MKAKRLKEMTEEELEQYRLAQCRAKREVRRCEDCCRFRQCILGETPMDPNELLSKGEKALLMDIITLAVEDYADAWKHGFKGQLIEAELFLKSEKVAYYSLGEFNSEGILSNLQKRLTRQYGTFEEIHNKLVQKTTPKIEKLKKKIEECQDAMERGRLRIRLKTLEKKIN